MGWTYAPDSNIGSSQSPCKTKEMQLDSSVDYYSLVDSIGNKL
jgi:hypothetical protein